MAKNNMTFRAALRLDSREFKKGVADIQRTLNGLKQSFLNFAGAIGISLGLGKFVDMIKDTAVKLDTAQNVLRNVSETTVEYAESMQFLRKISNDYGQDLITLTNNFAQFRAAAKSSGLAIDDLRDIYGSLTRAAGAYHLSAEKTNDMMNAVTQMFSKGKVASEELRRQLGNVLPGAFNLMAKAAHMAGVTTSDSTAELEDMMKKGKVLAADVMPAFAKVLDQITATANFDSLQQSISRLGNTWTKFVEKGNFSSAYKKGIDSLNGALGWLVNNLKTVGQLLLGGGLGILGAKLWNRGAKNVQKWKDETDAALNDLRAKAKKATVELEKLGATRSFTDKLTGQTSQKPLSASKLIELGTTGGISKENYKKALEAQLEFRKARAEYANIVSQSAPDRKSRKAYDSLFRNQTAQIALLEKELQKFSNSYITDMSAAEVVTSKLRTAINKVGGALKAALGSMVITALITAISTVLLKLRDIIKESNRIKNIVQDAEKSVNEASGAESEALVNAVRLRKEIGSIEQGSDLWKRKMAEANEIMGRTGDNAFDTKTTYEDIADALDTWIDKMKKIARYQAIINKMNELTAKNLNLESENDAIRSDARNYHRQGRDGREDGMLRSKYYIKLANNTDEIRQNNIAIDNLTKKLEAEGLVGYLDDTGTTTGNTNGGGGNDSGKTKTKLDEVNKVFDDYNEKLSKLNNQLKAGAITLDNYNDEYDKLIKDTYKSATEFGNLDEYLKGFDRQKVKGLKDKLEWLKLLFSTLDDDVNDDDRFKQIGSNLLEKIEKEIADGAEKAAKNRRNAYEAQGIYRNLGVPTERDTSFDYKKNDKEKLDEEYELMKDYLETLKDARNRLIELGQTGTEQFEQLNRVIGEVAGTVTNFADRAKLAEWKEDIKELAKAYQDELYNSVKNVTSSIDRLYRLYAEMAEMFGEEIDPDNGFAKMLTVVAALMDTFETIYTVIQSINALTEAASALEKAKDNAKMRALEEQIGLTAALGTAQVTASEAATAALVGETVAAKALGEALKNVAAGAAAANSMAVPYPGNLAALGSNMAAIAAAYGSIKAFANGGVVTGGPKTGDHTLIRASRGELVLNGKQQSTLFDILNGKKGVGGGEVEFKISGQNLVGVLKNYNQKMHG